MSKITTVCVYCGSRNRVEEKYKLVAEEMGKLLAENNFRLVYGGGRNGLMGIVADGLIRHGGYVIGFIPIILESYEGAHPDIQELHVVDSMHTRKARMTENADAFVILPGGFGTLDELFEIITWHQLKLHDKPIIVVNTEGYWDPLVQLMQRVVDKHFAEPQEIEFIKFVSTVTETILALKSSEAGTQEFPTEVI